MLLAFFSFTVKPKKNRQIWPATFHPDPRPPNQEVLVTRPWRINNTEELRQYIIHPLGSFSKISPYCCSGGFLCLLEIRGRGRGEEEEKDRGKNLSRLTTTVTRHQSRPQPCASTGSRRLAPPHTLSHTHHRPAGPLG